MISSPIAWPNGLFHLRAFVWCSLNILPKSESEKGNHKEQGHLVAFSILHPPHPRANREQGYKSASSLARGSLFKQLLCWTDRVDLTKGMTD